MAPQTDFTHFTFGLEMELLASPQDQWSSGMAPDYDDSEHGHMFERENNRSMLYWLFHSMMRNVGANVLEPDENVSVEKQKAAKDYSLWNIEHDPSIVELGEFYGIELNSPIFNTLTMEWKDEIEGVWGLIDHTFKVRLHRSCATHVHVRPEQGFSLENLKKVCKGVLYYGQVFEHLVPESQTVNAEWARMNYLSPNATELSSLYREAVPHNPLAMDALFDCIDSKASASDLVNFFSPDRRVAWNLQPSLDSRGTVEFRMPPQVTNWEQSAMWIAFTITFVVHCIQTDWECQLLILNSWDPTMGPLIQWLREDLAESLSNSAHHPGMLDSLQAWLQQYLT